MDFDQYSAELTSRCRQTPGVLGLILVGSTTAARASARDRWSDHDFFVLFADGTEQALRRELPFLPFRDQVVTVAREGEIGVSVLYADGHVFEFGAATVAELGPFRLGQYEIAYDTGPVAGLAAAAARRGAQRATIDAAHEVSLAFIKLLIGVGRTRRGELINGGSFVRTYAVGHLANAVLARLPYEVAPARDGLDPVRRFEEAYPSISRPLGEALDRPAEEAARLLYDLARAALEPGWDEFPTLAADTVAQQLGWS